MVPRRSVAYAALVSAVTVLPAATIREVREPLTRRAASDGKTGTAPIAVRFGRAQRPYTADSPWNTPIPADAAVDPKSAAMIATIAVNNNGKLRSSPNQYAYPVHFADATTPRVTLMCTGLVWVNAANGSAAKLRTKELPHVPIPLDARPGKGDDDQIIVIDTETGDEYDVYRFKPPNECQGLGILNALFLQKTQYCWARELSSIPVLGLESGHFRALHRSEALYFGVFWHLGRARSKGEGRLRG